MGACFPRKCFAMSSHTTITELHGPVQVCFSLCCESVAGPGAVGCNVVTGVYVLEDEGNRRRSSRVFLWLWEGFFWLWERFSNGVASGFLLTKKTLGVTEAERETAGAVLAS